MSVMIIVGAAAAAGLLLLVLYNGLVARKNAVENAFGAVDAQLKLRYDLIPNLVAAVKNYLQHEREVLTKLTELRTRALEAGRDSDRRVELDNQISHALRGLLVAVENYPDLKASQNFMQLQRSLNEAEAQISAARRTYNAVVTEYNNGVEMFPSNLIAGPMGLKRKAVFEIPQAERENVNLRDLFAG